MEDGSRVIRVLFKGRAHAADRHPENSVSDNTQTLRLVFATYRSMRECRALSLIEIDKEG